MSQTFDRNTFVQLWKLAKAQQTPDDADLARIQQMMVMHEEWHQHFEAMENDPNVPGEYEGANVAFQIVMEAATAKSLEIDEPKGVRQLMQTMLDLGLQPAEGFEVMARAMYDETLEAMKSEKDEMDTFAYFARAQRYFQEAMARKQQQ